MKFQSLLFTMLVAVLSFAQVPTITSFSPTSGPVGTSVTITGTNFSTTAANNTVFVGSAKATVTSATGTQLVVTLPNVASTNCKIQVIVSQTSVLSAVSARDFIYTYTGGVSSTGAINSHFTSVSTDPNVGPGSSEFLQFPIVGTRNCGGDFDSDGDMDYIVLAESSTTKMRIFKNTNATPTSSTLNSSYFTYTDFTMPAGVSSLGYYPFDMNNDGKLDVIYGGFGFIGVFVNTSSGGNISFSSQTITTTNISHYRFKIFDFNNDGILDIVSTGSQNQVNFQRLSWPSGVLTSTSSSIATSAAAQDVALSDVNQDGKMDVIFTTNGSTVSVCYALNSVSATPISFGVETAIVTGVSSGSYSSFAGGLASADFDNDGDLDIVYSLTGGAGELVRLIPLNGNVTFGTSVAIGSYTAGSNIPSNLRCADLNGDSKIDVLVVGGSNSANIRCILNNYSTGGLTTSSFTTQAQVGSSNFGAALEDFNADGKVDIISNGYYNTSINFVPNVPPIPPIAASPASLSNFSACSGIASTAQTTSISGTGLSANITLTAPSGYEISLSSGSGYASTLTLTQSGGTVAATTIYVRLNSTATAGTYNGNLSAVSGSNTTNIALTGTVEGNPSITQPSTTAIFKCYSSTAQAISVTTTATSPSYQWQQSTTSNGVFANVTTGTGGTTSSFTPAHSNIWYGGTMYYKCVVTSACGSTTSNASGAYTIGSDLVGTSFPSAFDQTYCNGATATPLTVNYASSTNWPSLTYQWKESSTQNGTFTNVTAGTGATTASYTPSTGTNGTKYYQCWVGGTCGNAASAPTSGAITVSPGLNTWTGAVSNDPATAGNWSTCGTGSDVIIPAGAPNYPVYNDYTVAAGQTVTIATGAQLTVNGILTNDGTIIIQSGATLVQGATSTTAGSGNYIVKQVVSGIGNIVAPTGRFWYLGSPVASESSSVFFNSLTTTNTVVKKRSETTNSWIQITSGTPEALEVGRGYYAQIRPSANSSSAQNIPLSFSGAINNYTTTSPLTLNLTRTTNSFAGFNLVSNPFPSYLDWDAVTRTNVGNTMWYRTATGNASNTMVFETYVAGAAGGIGTNLSGNVATKLIPPMQAFWVRVNSGNTTGSITLDNSMRSHFTSISGSTAGLRSTNDELKLFLRMNLLQENKKDQLIVYMNNAATNGFDILDGEKMMQAELPQFYTTAGEKKITINGLNAAKKQQSLPIMLELPTTGVHTFEIEKLELEAGLVWLEDTQEGTMNALSDGITYAFYAEAGMNNDRFVLHFNILDNTTPSAPNYGEVNSSANFSGKGASVHAEAAGVVVIKLPATTEGVTDIQIRDAGGKLVYTGSTNTLETSVQLAQANGIYYVTLNSASGVEVRKVFIQQ